MKKLLSTLCASALAASMAVVGVAPSMAMPKAPTPAPVATTSDGTVLVQFDERDLRRLRRERRIERRIDRVERRETRRAIHDLERRGDNYYYRGYRGYRYSRPGYRRYNGYYFPSAAFIAGAIVTGAIANSQVRSGGGSAHVDWCYNRYRSYRASDNSYQPLSGPRRQCYSPYD